MENQKLGLLGYDVSKFMTEFKFVQVTGASFVETRGSKYQPTHSQPVHSTNLDAKNFPSHYLLKPPNAKQFLVNLEFAFDRMFIPFMTVFVFV